MMIARHAAAVKRDPSSVVTIGTFDGVHRGHRQIIDATVAGARSRGVRSVVVTFQPHPKEVVASTRGPVRLLTTLEERLELLQGLGVDLVYVIDFTRQFSQQSAREFYQRNVIGEVGVSAVVVGDDHMFGRDRSAGNTELHAMGDEFGFAVHIVPACVVDGVRVSSTRVRNALSDGDVASAARFLGYPYRMRGRVIPGDDRGKRLGYPTANLAPISEQKVIPARGVYVVRVGLEGETRYGMMNIGTRPTVTDAGVCTMEVHLLDFEGNLYGRTLALEFLSRLREERRFASVDELVQQLSQDREQSKNVADAWEKRAE